MATPLDFCAGDPCRQAEWQPDADITGPGLLIAFIATSTSVLAILTVAYFADTLPEDGSAGNSQPKSNQRDHHNGLYNDLDTIVTYYACSPVRWLVKCGQRSSTGNGESVILGTKTRVRLRKTIGALVLTLADQQLVGGLAIAIIVYSQHCTMSFLHFYIVLIMGYFASTTHLSTLSVLEQRVARFPILRYIRIGVMLALSTLVIIGLHVANAGGYLFKSLQCRLQNLSWSRPLNIYGLCHICMASVLALTWISKTARLLSANRIQPNIFKLDRSSCNAKSRRVYYARKLQSVQHNRSAVIKCFILFTFAYAEFFSSYLWQILWLAFWNAYGIRWLMSIRYITYNYSPYNTPIFQSAQTNFNFGQLLALLLLALPVLIALEAWSDSKDYNLSSQLNKQTNRQTNHSLPVSGLGDILGEFDPYSYRMVQTLLVALFAYTTIMLLLIVYFIAWPITTPSQVAGAEIGLVMVAVIVAAGAVPFTMEVRRVFLR